MSLGVFMGRTYFKCTGEPIELPADTAVFTELDPVQPGRWLVRAAGQSAYRFASLDDMRRVAV